MGITVYTYKNPFFINKSSYWNEIKKYPHLCASERLANGLTSYYGRLNFTNITSIGEFLDEFYKIWVSNIENEISQYISISDEIVKIKDEKMQKAFKFNQRQIMDSIRMIKELNIDIKDIGTFNLSTEQKVFLDIYKSLKDNEYFNRIDMLKYIGKDEYCHALKDTLKKEILKKIDTNYNSYSVLENITDYDFENLINKKIFKLELDINNAKNNSVQKKLSRLSSKKVIENKFEYISLDELKYLKNLYFDETTINLDKVVIHGLHRFTPIIMHFIDKLQEIGIDIIFLFNYSDEYKRIYSTWDSVYSWTNKEFIEIDDMDYEYPYKPLGKALGDLLEGNIESVRTASIDKYKIKIYDNITTFCDEVSSKYDEVVKESNDKSRVLSKMSTQFYAVKIDETNEILKIYYPDQFEEKHFLSYPIGQFILGIYNMWDNESKKLIINDNGIKECLTPGFWKMDEQSTDILETYNKVKLYFKDLEDIEKIIDRLCKLEENIKLLNSIDNKEYFFKFSFFNVDIKDITILKNVMEDLNQISKELFLIDSDTSNSKISYNTHYKNLLSILNDKSRKCNYDKEEINFIREIEARLDSMKKNNKEIKGNIEDLQETIHFYLNRKSVYKTANWIVRDFEQIDGGIFLSKLDKNKQRRYQYCLLSDRNMKPKVNEMLTWPLSVEMFDKVNYTNKNLDIVMNSYKEYKNFLRYFLFYGTIFNDAEIELSYIKDQGQDELETPYFLLKMLGLEEVETYISDKDFGSENSGNLENNTKNLEKFNDPSRTELEIAHVCSYRYLLNKIIEKNDYYESEYQIRYYCIVLLFVVVVESLKSKNLDMNNSSIKYELDENLNIIKKLMPFWNDRDLRDIRSKALFELEKEESLDNIKDIYLNQKINFLVASIKDKNNEGNNLINVIHKQDLDPYFIINYLENYNTDEKENYNINPQVCEYCNQKEICLNYFKTEDSNG